MLYEVKFPDGQVIEFPDGQVKEYAANIIAENLLTQVDEDGYSLTMMKDILASQKDAQIVVPIDSANVIMANGQSRPRKTTKGWKLLVLWEDGLKSWIPLKDMKESHPFEVAEFARSQDIDKEPAFNWWVPYTLKKHAMIISKIKACIQKTTHKYGIEIP